MSQNFKKKPFHRFISASERAKVGVVGWLDIFSLRRAAGQGETLSNLNFRHMCRVLEVHYAFLIQRERDKEVDC